MIKPSKESSLNICQAAELPRQEGCPWLIESLWAKAGVGIIGGPPKSCKTWLALELAVAVAGGKPALGRFEIPQAGAVLLMVAEDAPAAVRTRLEGLAAARGSSLEGLNLHVIREGLLRLDLEKDQRRLEEAVFQYQAKLLILDPLVRLHRLDENSAHEISGLLGFLRSLQRKTSVAVVLVHHTRKNGAQTHSQGQSLRGSGDLHAWGDSNLYLRRKAQGIELIVEHRSASAIEPIVLDLVEKDPGPRLEIQTRMKDPVAACSLEGELCDVLSQASGPMTQQNIRKILRVRTQRLGFALQALEEKGRVRRLPTGWIGSGAPSLEGGTDEPPLFSEAEG